MQDAVGYAETDSERHVTWMTNGRLNSGLFQVLW